MKHSMSVTIEWDTPESVTVITHLPDGDSTYKVINDTPWMTVNCVGIHIASAILIKESGDSQ